MEGEAPLWAPAFILTIIGGIVLTVILAERRRKNRTRKIVETARNVWYMVLEDRDDADILRTVDSLCVSRRESKIFIAALKLSMAETPIPWYRPDASTKLMQLCGERLANRTVGRTDSWWRDAFLRRS
jgi:hypothetical protein